MCRRIEYANRWAAFSAWQQSQVAAPSQAALEHLGRSGALGTNPTTPKRTRSVGVQTENLGGTVMTKDFRFLAKHGFFTHIGSDFRDMIHSLPSGRDLFVKILGTFDLSYRPSAFTKTYLLTSIMVITMYTFPDISTDITGSVPQDACACRQACGSCTLQVVMPNQKLQRKRKLTPAESKKFGLKTRENRSFKAHHGVAYCGRSRSRTQWGKHLKDLEQPCFAEICGKSQIACRKMLEQHGVILASTKGQQFHCWACHTELTEKNGWRCNKWGCKKRGQITNVHLAYSPLFNQHAGGADVVDYRLALRAAFCLGNKVPNDSAAHFCRTPDETWKACKHKLDALYTKYKVCLAWSNYVESDKQVFQKDLVEVDSGRLGVRKRKHDDTNTDQKVTNCGRSLVLVGCFAKKWLLKGLPNRGASSGRCGPETVEEVQGTIVAKLKKQTVLCGDGAKAWAAAARAAKRPMLKGVQHCATWKKALHTSKCVEEE